MTVSMLLLNTVESAIRSFEQNNVNNPWNIDILPLDLKSPVPQDIEIAKSHKPKNISKLAQEIRLFEEEYECYGKKKAKIELSVLNRFESQPDGNYVVVTGINPTPLGEGKSTTTVGVCQAWARERAQLLWVFARPWQLIWVKTRLDASDNQVKGLHLESKVCFIFLETIYWQLIMASSNLYMFT